MSGAGLPRAQLHVLPLIDATLGNVGPIWAISVAVMIPPTILFPKFSTSPKLRGETSKTQTSKLFPQRSDSGDLGREPGAYVFKEHFGGSDQPSFCSKYQPLPSQQAHRLTPTPRGSSSVSNTQRPVHGHAWPFKTSVLAHSVLPFSSRQMPVPLSDTALIPLLPRRLPNSTRSCFFSLCSCSTFCPCVYRLEQCLDSPPPVAQVRRGSRLEFCRIFLLLLAPCPVQRRSSATWFE